MWVIAFAFIQRLAVTVGGISAGSIEGQFVIQRAA